MCGALRGLRLSSRGILLSVVFSVFAAHAKTIAWYRFEEQTSGVTTQTSVFTNTIDAAKYPAYPAVCSFKNGTYDKQNLLYTPEVMPIYTNAFPSTLALSAPGDSDVLLENRGAVAVNMDNVNDRNNPVGAVLIDDHEDLRLQTFTIEFFTRIPQTVYGSNYQWRHLVSRTTSTYGEETFLIRGQNGDYMYPQYEFSTPLYDDSGTLTNFCKYSGSIYVRIDDDRWHHIAMTVDGDAKKVRFFIDHVLRKEVSYTGDLWYESGYPLAFGTNPQCSYAGCSEAIDEIRISDEALEVHEMLRYCRAGGRSEAVDENTLFYFPFEGSTQPQILGEGDVADPITYVPFYANASKNATWGAYDAVPNQKSSVTLVPPVPSEDVPTDGVRFGLRGETFQENGTSLHLKTNAPGDYVQPLVLPESFNQEILASESFTAEMYFKAVRPGYMATQEQTHFFRAGRRLQRDRNRKGGALVERVASGNDRRGYIVA